MRDLKDRPKHLMLLLPFVAGIFRIFQLVLELEKCVFDIVEALRWRLAIFAGASYRGHDGVIEYQWRVLEDSVGVDATCELGVKKMYLRCQ